MNQATGAVTADAIAAFKHQGSWRRLEQIALKLAANAQQQAGAEFAPHLGGGTRLMLALEHRISHDIDLFIRDPQWIGYLTPRLTDSFEGGLQAYDENAVSLKLRYAEGEIDFIVGMSLLGLPGETSADAAFSLEPVAEVLAKKLFYRGWALTPRDLFDWWMVETRLPAAVPAPKMAQLLKTKFAEIARALDHEVIVNLIANTTTRAGLKIRAELDRGKYPTGIKITDAELALLNLKQDNFHGDWNYTALPTRKKS